MKPMSLVRRGATVAAVAYLLFAITAAAHDRHRRDRRPVTPFDQVVAEHTRQAIEEGRRTFRFDTFGDEDFWGGVLQLHDAIQGAALGGVGQGVSPKTALAVGLKVDVDALPLQLRQALKQGKVNLDDPATTLALLKLNAVVGLTGFFDRPNHLRAVGIQCALCHSTVDNAFAPSIGHRLDGWANRDLDVGAIIALAPNLQPVADLLHTDVGHVKDAVLKWGPGKFDAELFLDGQSVQPNGRSAAVLIPPAFGLAGVNLHTWEGWGSVTHWNAFVANLEMHGHGTFFDPRLDNAGQFPIAAENHFGHLTSEEDRITRKLPALHFYQLALPAPAPPPGSFDEDAAERGDELFSGKAQCARCHTDELFTEPGWNMHRGDEIGIDNFQADRGPDHRYRTAPLKGIWTHTKGGFFHDGRFATLLDVVNHYDAFFHLGLTDGEKSDVVEYMKSLGDDDAPAVRHAQTLNAVAAGTEEGMPGAAAASASRLQIRPEPAARGTTVFMDLPVESSNGVPRDLDVGIYDLAGRRIARVAAGNAEIREGVATIAWDGRDQAGRTVAPGVYFVRAVAPASGYQEWRRVVIR